MSSNAKKALIIPLLAGGVRPEWPWRRLDEVADVYDCPHSTPELVEDQAAPFVVRSQDVRSGSFLTSSAARVSQETYVDRIRRVEPHFGDLVYSREGTYFGIAAEVPKGIQVCLGQRMVLIRPNVGTVDHSFLKYWLNSPLVFGHIHGFRDGTVAERLNLPVIRGLPVALPPISEQREMAGTLTALDDRITLLRETNATLEAIAQALFKSWFVDFDPVHAKQQGRVPEGMDEASAALFPDSFEESELGLVPSGWRVGRVTDLGEVICGKTPPTTQQENYGDDVPFITIPDMHNLLAVTSTNRSLSRLGAETQRKKYLPPGSVCVSCIATPGLVVRVTAESQTNQQINSVVPIAHWGKAFPLFLLRRIGNAVRAGGSGGSVFHNLSKSGFEELKVLLSEGPIAQKFDHIVEPLVSKIIQNQQQAQTLATLRDTLLPRLISGQLRLPEAEAMLESA